MASFSTDPNANLKIKARTKSIRKWETNILPKGKVVGVDHGDLCMVQPANVLNGKLVKGKLIDRSELNIQHHHFLRSPSVLFVCKGSQPKAVVFEGNTEPTVASSSFLVLHPESPKKAAKRIQQEPWTNWESAERAWAPKKTWENISLDPHYLCWWLNHPATLDHIKRFSSGSVIKAVTIRQLKELPVALPPLEVQRDIARLAELQRQEEIALQKLTELKKQYYQEEIHQVFIHEA